MPFGEDVHWTEENEKLIEAFLLIVSITIALAFLLPSLCAGRRIHDKDD